MKRIITFIIVVIFSFSFATTKSYAGYITKDSTLSPTEDYSDISWADNVTITIKAGDSIYITPSAENGYLTGSGALVINGYLNIHGTLSLGDSLIVNSGAYLYAFNEIHTRDKIIVYDNAVISTGLFETSKNTKRRPIIIKNGGKITCGNAIITKGHLHIEMGGVLVATRNLDLHYSSNFVAGKIDVGGELKLNQTSLTMECPSYIYTHDLINSSAANSIEGTGFILVENNFYSPNALTRSEKIILNTPEGSTGNKGSAITGTAPNCVIGEKTSVNLYGFKATKSQTATKLSWGTHSETNIKGFSMQLSIDGSQYEDIGFVNSKSNNGSSTVDLKYDYLDYDHNEGSYYYRIKVVALDGSTDGFSNTVQVQTIPNNDIINNIRIYPNPASNYIQVLGIIQANIRIINISGYKVLSSKTSKINISTLSPGMYILQNLKNGYWYTIGRFIKK